MENTESEINLKVEDLAVIKSIIEVVSQRGAIQPDEMSTVGVVYDKLNLFLSSLASNPQAEISQEQAEPEQSVTRSAKKTSKE